jgi:hypothetical protein
LALFVWLVADADLFWGKVLLPAGWFVPREKYCRLVLDKVDE